MIQTLETILANESTPVARATYIFALGHLLPLGQNEILFNTLTQDRNSVVRLVSAMMLGQRLGTQTPELVQETLLDAFTANERMFTQYRKLPMSGRLYSDLLFVMEKISNSALEQAQTFAIRQLSCLTESRYEDLVISLLQSLFEETETYNNPDRISPLQRSFLQTLLALPTEQREVGIAFISQSYRLASTYEGLQILCTTPL